MIVVNQIVGWLLELVGLPTIRHHPELCVAIFKNLISMLMVVTGETGSITLGDLA